jgi:hypothetical protein
MFILACPLWIFGCEPSPRNSSIWLWRRFQRDSCIVCVATSYSFRGNAPEASIVYNRPSSGHLAVLPSRWREAAEVRIGSEMLYSVKCSSHFVPPDDWISAIEL